MKLKKCPSNHYYDASKHEQCPHCSSPGEVESIIDSIRGSIKQSLSSKEYVSPSVVTEQAVQPIVEMGGKQAKDVFKQEPAASVPFTDIFSYFTPSRETPLSQSVPNDMKTVAMWNAPAGAEPVVGWLVCAKGCYFGQSFTLKAGNNSVGRSMEMDVPLAQESTVSRNRHCIITFEPENQEFFIQPGESESLTYLNGNLIMSFTKINSRDIVKLGNCEFMFYPLCSDKFNWNKII